MISKARPSSSSIRRRTTVRTSGSSPASSPVPACSEMSEIARTSKGPLSDSLVIAIEHDVAVPLCTVRLADAGARVIKIERPDGETARHYDATVEGASAYFVWLDRGKESAALD